MYHPPSSLLVTYNHFLDARDKDSTFSNGVTLGNALFRKEVSFSKPLELNPSAS